MTTRKNCSHHLGEGVFILVKWCERCSGWGVWRLAPAWGSHSESSSLELAESHFLPQEETSPDELLHFIQRAFVTAQEIVTERSARRVY